MSTTNKRAELIFDKVHEAILMECACQCQKCNKVSTGYNIDDYGFAEKLINEGWTFNRERILCNDCAPKKKL